MQSMKIVIPSHEPRTKLSAVSSQTLVLLCFLLSMSGASAAPRAAYPPLPELVSVLHRETFNAVYQAGVSNAVVVLPNYGTLRESWSGYALERVGVVPPFVIPGVDERKGSCFSRSSWRSNNNGAALSGPRPRFLILC